MNEQHVTFERSLRLAIGLLAAVLMAAGLLAGYGSDPANSVVEMSTETISVDHNVLVLACSMVFILIGFAWGWVELALLPDHALPRALLVTVTVIACVVAGLGQPQQMAYVAAFSVPVAFVGEMLRRDGRPHLLRHVSGVYMGIVMILSGAMWILLAREPGGAQLGLVGVAALIGGTIARYFVPGRWRELLVFLSAGLGGIIATIVITGTSWWAPLVFAFFYFAVTWAMGRVSRANTTVWQGSSAASFALIPHCAFGIVGYALGLLVL